MSEPYRFSLSPETPFSFSKIFAHPGDLASYDPGKRRKHVCIVGAGIAGLAAAFELAQLGHDPVVLEAADRVGGRIRTHRFADGQHAEFGAMRIPASHHCTLHYAEKLDLQLRPFVNFNPLAYLHLRGMRSRIKDWHAVAERFLLDASERKDPFKLLEDHMRQAWVPLTTADKWRMFSSDLSPRLKEYDSISFWQWLCRINGISSEAFEYIGHSSGLVQYERASFLEVLIDYFGLFRLRQWEIVGGMDRLALGFARRLAGRIHLNSSVTAIAATASGVWVHWLSMQGSKKEHFDYVICAVPAHVCWGSTSHQILRQPSEPRRGSRMPAPPRRSSIASAGSGRLTVSSEAAPLPTCPSSNAGTRPITQYRSIPPMRRTVPASSATTLATE